MHFPLEYIPNHTQYDISNTASPQRHLANVVLWKFRLCITSHLLHSTFAPVKLDSVATDFNLILQPK